MRDVPSLSKLMVDIASFSGFKQLVKGEDQEEGSLKLSARISRRDGILEGPLPLVVDEGAEGL